MSNVDKSKLQKLLAQDLPQVAIANALGCSEGYISQCMADDAFRAQVAAIRIARLEGAGDRDDALDKLEGQLIEKMEKAVNYMIKPRDILDAFKVINSAKRSNSVALTSAGDGFGQQARIILPRAMAVTFVQNNFGEIVEAGGRSLATLPANVLKQMAATKQQQLLGVSNDGNNTGNAFTLRRAEAPATNEATAPRAAEAKAA